MDDLIARAAAQIIRSQRVVALTGAGISVESGIPPFRGKGGVWETIDPMEFAHIDAFMRNPEKVWRVLIMAIKKCLDKAMPNAGHVGLADLEGRGHLTTVITQNVDGLHQLAGNTDVIEFHGTFATLRCLDCGCKTPARDIDLAIIPPRCACGGIYRPDCIFFGELIPVDALARSQALAAACEVMLVVGTSAMVQPAAFMPVIARDNGAVVIEINPEPTPLTGAVSDFLISGKAGAVMRRLVDAVAAVS